MGIRTLQEEAGVSNGLVLRFPDSVELQKRRGVHVVQHGDDLLPAVALPARGQRGSAGRAATAARPGGPSGAASPRFSPWAAHGAAAPRAGGRSTARLHGSVLTWRGIPPSGPAGRCG